jgi:glycosyltransferase involved in cell wall biosynthesis
MPGIRRLLDSEPTSLEALSYRNPITTPGQVLIRRVCFENTEGFRQRFRLAEDWDLYLQLAAHGTIGFLPEVVLDYRRHTAAASNDLRSMRRAELAVRRHWSEDPSVSTDIRGLVRLAQRAFEKQRIVERLRQASREALRLRFFRAAKDVGRALLALMYVTRSLWIRSPERTQLLQPGVSPDNCRPAVRTVVHVPITYRRAGTEQIVLDLAEAALADGWRVVIAIPDDSALDAFEGEVEGIGADAARVGDLFGADRARLRNLTRLYRVFRAYRADVVHLHFPWAPTCFEAVLAAWLARVPVRIRTEHNPIMQSLSRLQTLKMAVLDRMITEIVCVSRGNRDRHIVNGRRPAAKVSVITNGVRPGDGAADAREIAQLRDELAGGYRHLVVMVGALEERKGVLDFVHVVATVGRPATAKFLVLGTGPLMDRAQALATELGVIPHLQFLGQRQDVANILRAADLYVQPSHFEGCSIAMLEALVAGCPIVTTEVDGVADVNDLCPSLAPPACPIGDIRALANAVSTVLADVPRYTDLAAARRPCIERNFSVDVMCQRYLERYRALLA